MKLLRFARLMRERQRLHAFAVEQGFDSTAAMLYELYITQDVPVEEISRRLLTPMWTLRKLFDEYQIPVGPRGGRNNVKLEMTPELIQEVMRDGVPAVAERTGIEAAHLYVKMNDWKRRKDQEEKT